MGDKNDVSKKSLLTRFGEFFLKLPMPSQVAAIFVGGAVGYKAVDKCGDAVSDRIRNTKKISGKDGESIEFHEPKKAENSVAELNSGH